MINWREYQEEIADFFRALGCKATVEAVVQGARSKHQIDVWVVVIHQYIVPVGLDDEN